MTDIRSEDLELFHYGVKGMKWGVRRTDEQLAKARSSAKSSDQNDGKSKDELKSAYLAAGKADKPKKLSKAEQAKSLAENQKKFLEKSGFSEEDTAPPNSEKGWRPTKKQVATVVVGAAAVGLIVYGSYKLEKYYNPPPGSLVPANQFKDLTTMSKMSSWIDNDYIKPSSYDQKEFTLPAGHTFNRISKFSETDFSMGTYATASTEDFNRYVTAFRGELGTNAKLKHVTFTAKEEIKVPDLVTRLETFRQAYNDTYKIQIDESKALDMYKLHSGGSWDDDIAENFFGALKKKGYSAIIDDMDAGVIGEAPLVMFDTAKFSSKVAVDLTPEAIKAAESNVRELANRKR